MSPLPSEDEIRALHQRYAPNPDAFDLVWTHCRIVRDVADQLLARRRQRLDAALVRVGCLLHDIGVYRLYDRDGEPDPATYLRHGVAGAELFRELGWPDRIARFCAHHTGVGLTREDVVTQRLPLPPGDYLAETPEEELVMFADKFHSKTTPPVFVRADSYAASVRRFGAGKVARFAELRATFGDPDLLPLAAAYGHRIR